MYISFVLPLFVLTDRILYVFIFVFIFVIVFIIYLIFSVELFTDDNIIGYELVLLLSAMILILLFFISNDNILY